jgi:preprotein translocase subunit SecD
MRKTLSVALSALLTAIGIFALPQKADAFAKKPKNTVRFFVEVGSISKDPFSLPVTLTNPTRHSFMERAASLGERHITASHVYPVDDGTWACLFKLDDSGRLILQNISSSNRGRALVAYVGSEKAARQILDLHIDQTITDGMIPIPRGLTYGEALQLQKQFPPLKPSTSK